MCKHFTLLFTVILAAFIGNKSLAQVRGAKNEKKATTAAKPAATAKPAAAAKPAVKPLMAKPVVPAAPAKKDTAAKKIVKTKKFVKRRRMTPLVTHQQETIEVDNESPNAVVEISKGEVYVNGDLISTIDDWKHEDHKIVIRMRDEDAARRKPIDKEETKEDHLRRPMLGVYSDQTSDLEGAHINAVIRNSPAHEAGLLVGDIITHINNRAVRDAQELNDVINDHNGGETVRITFVRQGREYHTEAELTETTVFRRHDTYRYTVPDLHGNRRFPTPFLHSYMYNNSDNTFEYAPQMGIGAQDAQNGRGVVVLKVKRNSPADAAGLSEGDVLLRIDHQRVMSVDDIQDILNDTWPNQRIKLEFKRDGVLMFAYMRFTRERVKREL